MRVNLWVLCGILLMVRPGFTAEMLDRYPFAKGVIEKLNVAAGQIILAESDGPLKFAINDRTYLFRGKDKITLDKLKVGEPVKINYFTNETGQAIIRRLKIDLATPEPETPPK